MQCLDIANRGCGTFIRYRFECHADHCISSNATSTRDARAANYLRSTKCYPERPPRLKCLTADEVVPGPKMLVTPLHSIGLRSVFPGTRKLIRRMQSYNFVCSTASFSEHMCVRKTIRCVSPTWQCACLPAASCRFVQARTESCQHGLVSNVSDLCFIKFT